MFALRTKGKYENEQITLLRDQWWQALTAKKKRVNNMNVGYIMPKIA